MKTILKKQRTERKIYEKKKKNLCFSYQVKETIQGVFSKGTYKITQNVVKEN